MNNMILMESWIRSIYRYMNLNKDNLSDSIVESYKKSWKDYCKYYTDDPTLKAYAHAMIDEIIEQYRKK